MENQNKNQKILVVEDEIIIAMDLKSKLESFGYIVTDTVSVTEDALASAANSKPDLALMDINIKGDRDGIETAIVLKERFDIPVVYLTAFIDEETVERARISAPDGYLIKPVQDKELEITIKMSLHKSILEKKLKKNQLLLDTILTNVGEGIISVDNEFKVVFLNQFADKLLGIKGADIGGKSVDELFLIVDESEEPKTYLPSEIIKEEPYDQIHLVDRFVIETLEKTKVPVQINYSVMYNEKFSPQGFIFVLQDITERRENESKRRKLMQELKAKKNELEQIISFASLDLRTPLINIIGFSRELNDSVKLLSEELTFIKNEELDDFYQVEKIEKDLLEFSNFIQDSGKKLSLMFNGLLELSNSEKREPFFEEIYTNELVQSIIEDLSFRMLKKDTVIRKGNLKDVYGDKLLISQVFGNLLDNAIKFSKPNSKNEIHISQTEDDKSFTFCIEDMGIGIEDDFKEKIFGYFESGEGNKFQGNGLGLAIVKKIIEKHSGDIWFESEVNKGTKFFFSIPKKPDLTINN